jgi:hypothetical protein
MKPRTSKRMERVAQVIAARPIRADALDKAFAHFCDTGELPDQQRLADEVARRALRGRQEPPDSADSLSNEERQKRFLELFAALRQRPAEPEQPEVRECVFHEAVFGNVLVRRAARLVLVLEVERGGDPADPKFLADRTLPDHAAVSMHLLGYPERLAKPPYLAQAKRLFARYDELRVRINRYEDDPWFDLHVDAVIRFEDTGDLPDDELLRDAVLAHEEWDALQDHARGRDVSEWMTALDRAARAKGVKRDEAIEEVQAIVRQRVQSKRFGTVDSNASDASVQTAPP